MTSETEDRRMSVISCHKCGHNMWTSMTVEGDDRVFVMECINPKCDNPGIVELSHREPVTAFLCGPGGGGGATTIGYIWAPGSSSTGRRARMTLPNEVTPSLSDALRLVVRYGFTPVDTARYERLRAWLDANGYWPPKDWQPQTEGQSNGAD